MQTTETKMEPTKRPFKYMAQYRWSEDVWETCGKFAYPGDANIYASTMSNLSRRTYRVIIKTNKSEKIISVWRFNKP